MSIAFSGINALFGGRRVHVIDKYPDQQQSQQYNTQQYNQQPQQYNQYGTQSYGSSAGSCHDEARLLQQCEADKTQDCSGIRAMYQQCLANRFKR